jgi:ethanolamine ammonia-lyase small subunit
LILGRDFVSYELDPRTHDIGQLRLQNAIRGQFARKDQTRIARFLMKHPEAADQVFSMVPKECVRTELDLIVREQTKLTKEAVIKVLTDDAMGDRSYEKLVKEIYK